MNEILFAIALSFIATAQAADNSAPSNTTVRCQGLKQGGIPIGIDIEMDPVDRLVNVTTFERDTTFIEFDAKGNINNLGAPSNFIKRDGNKLLIFGFKSFNDGLEENISVSYVINSVPLTSLRFLTSGQVTAAKDVSCRILTTSLKSLSQ
jgi:hypothetical protein